ncbi:MAG TPA: GtrA family protein [Sulfuriferula sp.]|nr:GtrA family protein [Sulfuriferula sp.]
MMGLVRQSLRFGAVGLVNTAIGLTAIYALMFFFSADPALANVVGYAIGLTVSFALNRAWTFNNTQPVIHVMPKYLLTAAASYLLNLGAVVTCTSYLSANPYLAQLVGVGIYTVCMFFGCRWFVFGPRHAASQTST